MIERIKYIIATIEDPGELIQKVGILLVLFCAGALLTGFFVRRLCRAFCEEKTFFILWHKLEMPNAYLGGFVAVFAALPYIELPEDVAVYYLRLSLRILLFICLLAWCSRLTDGIFDLIQTRLVSQGKPVPVAIFFFGRIIKGMVSLVVMTAVVPSLFFGYQVLNTLVRYIGVSSISAGAIAGLSLQPTVKDVLGGLFVISQNLFTEGDWIECKTGRNAIAGRVVDVTLRYTKLKRWTGSFLMVPNNTFLSTVIDNYGRAHYTSYALPLTAGQQGKAALKAFLQGYQDLITASPHIEEDKCHVTVKSLHVGKMELELHIFFNKTDDEDKVVRIHTFWQDILQLVKKQKLSVAIS